MSKRNTKDLDKGLSDSSDEEEEEEVKKTTKTSAAKAKKPATSDDSSEDEVNLLKSKTKRQEKAKKEESSDDSDSEEEEKPKKSAKKTPAKKEESSDESSESEKPKKSAKKAPAKKEDSDSDSDSEEELIPKKTSLIKGTSELAEANEGDLTDTSSVLPLYEKDGLDPQEVLNVDIPERIIEKYKDRDLKELSTEDRISSFAHWLKERKFSDKMSEELIKVLIFIITKHRVEFYDIPYIATYFQKEISRVGLKSDDVYLMFSLYEEEYLSFENEKDRAVLLFHILENYISPIKDQKDLFYNVYINECKYLFLYSVLLSVTI